MKPLFFLVGLFVCCIQLAAQSPKKMLVNEGYFSVNSTYRFDDEYSYRFGWGFGSNHSFRLGKVVEYQLGAEFNHTSLYYYCSTYRPGHIFDRTYNLNITNNINCLSIPTGFRYSIGKNVKAFFEHGFFYDFTLFAAERGTSVVNMVTQDDYDINLTVPDAYGIYNGIGIRIPGKDVDYIVKTDFKLRLVNDRNNHPFYFKMDIGIKMK
jgi:hypothetical protein